MKTEQTATKTATLEQLCSVWNDATCPYKLRTDEEHAEQAQIARDVMAQIKSIAVYGRDYTERSNGALTTLVNNAR